MADFLAEKLQEIDNRLKELRPLHEEYLKLERAKEALDGMDSPRAPRPRPPARVGMPPAPALPERNGRRRRRALGGTAADEALEVVRQNPGIKRLRGR